MHVADELTRHVFSLQIQHYDWTYVEFERLFDIIGDREIEIMPSNSSIKYSIPEVFFKKCQLVERNWQSHINGPREKDKQEIHLQVHPEDSK